MINIAIDGPAGAGKSYLAKEIARRLGYIYVDTGALYRTIALYMVDNGIDTKDAEGVTKALDNVSVSIKHADDGTQQVYLNGINVSDRIRLPEISMGASAVSAIPEVRKFLLSLQRDIAKANNVVMDGRDIGTVILPDAQVKIFLSASAEARAHRRYLELLEKGVSTTPEQVLAEMTVRDKNDSTRSVAPAIPAEDAVMLDNSGLDREGSVRAALDIISEKIG